MKLVEVTPPVESVLIELDPGELSYLAGIAGHVRAGQRFGGRSFQGLFSTLDNIAKEYGDRVVALDVLKSVVFPSRRRTE